MSRHVIRSIDELVNCISIGDVHEKIDDLAAPQLSTFRCVEYDDLKADKIRVSSTRQQGEVSGGFVRRVVPANLFRAPRCHTQAIPGECLPEIVELITNHR